MQQNQVLTKKQAAAQLLIGVSTLEKMLKRGELAHVTISERRIGVLQSDLNDYLASRRTSIVSEVAA